MEIYLTICIAVDDKWYAHSTVASIQTNSLIVFEVRKLELSWSAMKSIEPNIMSTLNGKGRIHNSNMSHNCKLHNKAAYI